jgi:hypothetical protein
MKLTLAATLLFAATLPAAPWDGTKGDVTLSTFTAVGLWGPAPYSTAPAATRHSLFIKVICANPAVSAVRISITLSGTGLTRTESQVVPLSLLRSGQAVFPDATEDMLAAPPVVTLLFDGVTVQF